MRLVCAAVHFGRSSTQQIQCSATVAGDCDQRARTQCQQKGYDVLTRDVSGGVANIVIACQPG
ncbi:hypothetical protein ACNHE5_16170 [Pandoraea pnomenusa]|uniref:hypothetical protein n=1 Tax=Pandoraea pnomenusa TaxID=93220 RepID=UPI003CF5D6AA